MKADQRTNTTQEREAIKRTKQTNGTKATKTIERSQRIEKNFVGETDWREKTTEPIKQLNGTNQQKQH